ncbi:hypothetical protein [Candidatus Manganitrophus noduliformans]|uniref:Uncharacterized protein n=1 Tax=Candidatus Manganitrophus noduliformans TaxID=2606439 RepID=A0A7X6IA93_9BACT|nr:hypothetical protein [Candidatus Manganitrophus noduliformans]NKE70134.1 hypothetical protein [Candidatus Manganitrophus noduliformans]
MAIIFPPSGYLPVRKIKKQRRSAYQQLLYQTRYTPEVDGSQRRIIDEIFGRRIQKPSAFHMLPRHGPTTVIHKSGGYPKTAIKMRSVEREQA